MLASKQHQPLSRRISYAPAPAGDRALDFLVEPLADLASSFETLQENFECIKDVNDALVNFNNAFGSFLFGLSVNGACVEWPEAPQTASFDRYQQPRSNYTISAHDLLRQNATASNVMAHEHDAQLMPQSWKQDAEEEYAEVEQSRRMIRKYTGKININKIVERLPLKYREQQPHRENMEKVLKTLKLHPHGSNMPDLVSESGTQKHKCTDCLNALVHSKDVIKVNQQGSLVLYQLDPVKYPSALVAV